MLTRGLISDILRKGNRSWEGQVQGEKWGVVNLNKNTEKKNDHKQTDTIKGKRPWIYFMSIRIFCSYEKTV